MLNIIVLAALLSPLISAGPGQKSVQPIQLKVSDNHRFLVEKNGKPFFWLGDTAWEIFHRLNREEAGKYLEDRARKGFTVIQAVALAEFDGITVPNAYGHSPLLNSNPETPDIKTGPNNDYWDHVDYVVNKANALGLVVGFLPTWGSNWHDSSKVGMPIFNPQNAETYGVWIGNRYRNSGVVWILGGDRRVENDAQRETIRAMARGLRKGDGGNHLISFHPNGGSSSSEYFHNEPWLDFNMRQNGHGIEFTGRYEKTRMDYNLLPIKPVIDAEPVYEDHPIAFNAKSYGHTVAADVRRAAYWDLFGGACGHTFGNHAIWQMFSLGRTPVNDPLMYWTEAINQPGSLQMGYVRKLIESRPFLSRIPDDSVIVEDSVKTLILGAGTRHFCATRDSEGRYAMVYVPVGRSFSVHLDKISGQQIRAWWFNPRTGKATLIGDYPKSGVQKFVTPNQGELLDWVLVLDDASRNFPAPGQKPWKGN